MRLLTDPTDTSDVATKAYVDGAVNVAGGGSKATVTVDFGPDEQESATATVTDVGVTAGTVIVCSPMAVTTADHDPDDYAIEGVTAIGGNVQAGVGYVVTATAPRGTWGRYVIAATAL